MKKIALTLLLIFGANTLYAQTTLIKAKGYVNVETGELITPANIVVEGNIITAINPQSIPEDIELVDLGDQILLPGFMDMHVHLDLDFGPNAFQVVVTESGSKGALRGAKNAQLTLMAGFTTVRNLGQVHYSNELLDVALSEAINEGWITGPRIIPAGHMITILGGHGDLSMGQGLAENILDLGPETGVINGVDEAIHATRYQIKHGAKAIKIHATAGVLSTEESVGAQQLSNEEMKAIIEEAARHHIPVGAHAHGTEGIKNAISAGVSSIEHGSMLDDEAIQMMIDNNVFLVPTTGLVDLMNFDMLPAQNKAKAEYVLPLAKQSLSNAIDAGVKVALGSDAPVLPHGRNAYEILAMVDRGMSSAEALRSATMLPAELIQMEESLGQIKVGMFADIIGVNENPLEAIQTVEKVIFVMKDGIVYKIGE